MDFLIFDSTTFPYFSKKDIDNQKIPLKIYTIASFLRNIFLISNDMRSDNNIILFFKNQFPNNYLKKNLIIEINGKKLRYLSPDDRVILTMLQKINLVISGTSNKKNYKRKNEIFETGEWVSSTPGIILKYSDMDEFQKIILREKGIIIKEKIDKIDEYKDLPKINNLNELIDIIDNKSLLILPLEKDLQSNELQNLPFNQLYIFYNQGIMDHFFPSQIILILQTQIDNKF